MSTAPTLHTYEVDELEAMEDAVAYELEDGVLVERDMSYGSSAIGLEIAALLREFVKPRKLGRVTGADTSLVIWADRPRRLRRPDAAYISRERLPDIPPGDLTIAPDLVVEVMSPNEKAVRMNEKLEGYLEAGVRMVWIVFPETRTVHVHKDDGTAMRLVPGASIDGGDVIPGFSCPIAAFFEDAGGD